MNEKDPSISFIVVNHNRADLLKECLDSIVRQTVNFDELMVIDNASSDHSLNVVSSMGDERIHWLPQKENLGFAAAVNVGIAHAHGEWIGLLNNDAVILPDWLERMMDAIREDGVGMCASKIILTDGGLVDKAGHLIYADGQNRGRGSGQPDDGRFDGLEPALFPDGCAALYRKDLLVGTGGFDEDFFAYGDDADLGLRARWAGWDCRYVGTAVAYHRHSATTGSYSARKVYWIERNRMWLAVKNFPLPVLLLNPFLTANRWVWNMLAGLLGRGAAGGFRSQHTWTEIGGTILKAYLDGLRGVPGMWRKRRRILSARKISSIDFCRLLFRYRIGARALAFQDPEGFRASGQSSGRGS